MIKRLRGQFITVAMVAIGLVLLLLIGSINIINYVNVGETADQKLEILADNGGSFPELNEAPVLPGEMTVPEDSGYPGKDMGADTGNQETIDSDTNGTTGTSTDTKADTKFGGSGNEKTTNDGSDMENPPEPKDEENKNTSAKYQSEETPFDTRFFTVTVDSSGSATDVNVERIAAISDTDAEQEAEELQAKGKTKGFWKHYRFLATEISGQDGDSQTMYIFVDCQRELDTFENFLLASLGISALGLLLVFILVLFFSKMAVKPIAESYEKQKHFITDASHEIKTPLTIIDANTEVLEMENGENEWTKSIRNQIARLTELTNKLVFLSRMDEEATKLTMLDFSLSDAVEETAEPFRAVAEAKGLGLELSIEPNVTCHGDESSLRQLVSLLLDNAMKYTAEQGKISLTFKNSGNKKVLTVKNPAEGLKKGRYDMLFERFYRGDESHNSATKGHGIGLSVAQAIVLAHKGKISAQSPDGEHMIFTVLLP